MERGSAKHAPRVDDQLDHDTAALTHGAPDEGRTEGRMQEAADFDEPGLAVERHLDDDDGDRLDDAALDFRARLAASLRPSTFPAPSGVLRAEAREANAAPDVIEALAALPQERVYSAFGELWDDLGLPDEDDA